LPSVVLRLIFRVFREYHLASTLYTLDSTRVIRNSMPTEKKANLTLTFNGKVRGQLESLIPKTNANSLSEVVRKAIDLLIDKVENSNNKSELTEN